MLTTAREISNTEETMPMTRSLMSCLKIALMRQKVMVGLMSTDCQTVKAFNLYQECWQMEGLSYFITGAANGISLEYTKMALRVRC